MLRVDYVQMALTICHVCVEKDTIEKCQTGKACFLGIPVELDVICD